MIWPDPAFYYRELVADMGSHGSLLIFLTTRALYFLSLHRKTNPRGISTFLSPLWFGDGSRGLVHAR